VQGEAGENLVPTYTYKCKACMETKEVVHAMSESVETCDCGGVVVKILSPTAVLFKGSGFFSTDNS